MRRKLLLPACASMALWACAAGAWATAAATTTTLAVASGGVAVTTVASGEVVTLTGTVKAGTTSVTTGLVNFCDAAAKSCSDIHLLGSAQLTKSGTAVFKFRPGIGSHSYKAVFAGTTKDAKSASAAASLAVTGLPHSQTSMVLSGSFGDYTLTATVGGSGSAAPTGIVSFLDTTGGDDPLADAPLVAGPAGINFAESSAWNSSVYYLGALVAADFNGDGIPDLAVIVPDQRNAALDAVEILLGNGDGTFTSNSLVTVPNLGPNAIQIADFNGDGKEDVALEGTGNEITVLLGIGDGTFTTKTTDLPPGPNSFYSNMAVGDFNGDGIPDLAVASAPSSSVPGTVAVLLGNGDGTFTAAAASPATGIGPQSVVTGDFNSDGNLDLAVVSVGYGTSPGSIIILLGEGNGDFKPAGASLSQSGYHLVSGDFNGDGNLDLAVMTGDSVAVFLGKGNGAFTPGGTIPNLAYSSSMAVGDFNGDGIADLALSQNLLVMFGDGKGNFTPAQSGFLQGPDNLFWLAAADFNGDGIADLASPGTQAAKVLLTENHISTATVSEVAPPLAPGPIQVAASYDGDSHYQASGSPTIDIPRANPALSLATSTDAIALGSSVTLTATLTGAIDNVAPTGYVTFTSGAELLGTVQLSGGGTASVTTGAFGLGCHGVKANYDGDSNYSGVSSAAAYLWVAGAGQPIQPPFTLVPSASSISFGGAVSFTGTLDLRCHIPGGQVTFFSGYNLLGAAALNASGVTTFSTNQLAGGMNTITAQTAGGVNYPPVTSSGAKVTVNPVASSVNLSAYPPLFAQGSPLTMTAVLTGIPGFAGPTGAVTFTAGSHVLGTATANGGIATLSTTALLAGTHSIVATYAGDNNYLAAVSSAVDVRATGNTIPVVKLTASAVSVLYGVSVKFTAKLTGSGTAPTGTVILFDGASPLDAVTVGSSGVVTFTTDLLAVGQHQITAAYQGNGVYAPASSAPLDVTVSFQ